MSRRHRHTLIFSAVALLILVALVTANTPVGAWQRSTDSRADDGLSGVPLAGMTYQVTYVTAYSTERDTWYFAEGGQLIGETLGPTSSWSQGGNLSEWIASVILYRGQYVVTGRAFGPIIFGTGISGQVYPPYFWVVGIRGPDY